MTTTLHDAHDPASAGDNRLVVAISSRALFDLGDSHALFERDGLDAYRGLAQRSPLLALAMLLFLLSLGGIPFVAGFWAKLYVFLVGVERGLIGLVFVGAVLTVVALYYYLLVARRMFIEAPLQKTPVVVSASLGTTLVVCVIGVVGIGVYPAPWVDAARRIAEALF